MLNTGIELPIVAINYDITGHWRCRITLPRYHWHWMVTTEVIIATHAIQRTLAIIGQ